MIGHNHLGKNGRFGNQMFQYAATRCVAAWKGYEWCIPDGPKTDDEFEDEENQHKLFMAFELPSVKVVNMHPAPYKEEASFTFDEDLFKGDRFLISDSGDNITDMCLMSMCQYQIMANSTYSWWGAWLSNSENVIAPKLWFGPDGQDPKDIYVERWKYLDV